TQVEEERFETLLKTAIPTAERALSAWGKTNAGKPFPGEQAFELYDTYGLPVDLVDDLAKQTGLDVERAGFEEALARQRERARQSSKMGVVKGDPVYMELLEGGKTEFLGYQTLVVDNARVLAVLKDGALVRRLEKGDEGAVVIDRTPFYAMAGGQVGDH